MSEIKSTMELVMARAARIGKASTEELRQEEARQNGIQFAVEYMAGNTQDLLAKLQAQDQNIQVMVLKGMAETILRNIFLPRNDMHQERAEKAVQGIRDLDGGGVSVICDEVSNILGGYLQHRDQLRGQLEEQIKMQYENLMAHQPEMQRAGMQIDPTLQPKFQEEWNRVEAELDRQYGNALEQLKLQVKQRLGIA